MVEALQVRSIGLTVFSEPCYFFNVFPNAQRVGNLARNLPLQREQISTLAVIHLGEYLLLFQGVYQPGPDLDVVAGALYAALQNDIHLQDRRDGFCVLLLILESERRGSGKDAK